MILIRLVIFCNSRCTILSSFSTAATSIKETSHWGDWRYSVRWGHLDCWWRVTVIFCWKGCLELKIDLTLHDQDYVPSSPPWFRVKKHVLVSRHHHNPIEKLSARRLIISIRICSMLSIAAFAFTEDECFETRENWWDNKIDKISYGFGFSFFFLMKTLD